MRDATSDKLEFLRPSLAADGFELRLGSVDEAGAVAVILEATESACPECLVPDEIIVRILEDALCDQALGITKVTLVKVGFDGVAAH